jgi:hypothetical protein
MWLRGSRNVAALLAACTAMSGQRRRSSAANGSNAFS